MKNHLIKIHNQADVSNLPAMYSGETNQQDFTETEMQSETIQFVHEIETS